MARQVVRRKVRAERREQVLSVRLTDAEAELVRKAAGEIPPGIWARIALVRAARADVKGGKR